MFRKMILGATAVVALSAAVMSPSAAEAKHWKKHHHFHPHGYGSVFYGAYGMGGYGGGGCYVKRWVPTPYGMRLRVVNRCAW